MSKIDNYLIIAHYHSKGLIRKDFLNFLKKTKKIFKKTILISTNIINKEKLKIPKHIVTIRRKNIGYDFFSYKIGCEYFLQKFNKKLENKNLFFINSSILFVNSTRTINAIKSIKIKKNEMWGFTKSYELKEHIQSYFFSFSAIILKDKDILSWWKKIKPFTKRQDIIDKYELGLSSLMIKKNVKLCSLFKKNIKLKSINFFQKINQRFKEVFLKEIKIYKKNPTNYFWKDIYTRYGIVKIELIKKNPKKINISKLKKILKKKRLLVVDALDN